MTVLKQWADDTVAEATGREHRADPVLPVSGGPAGNARLTAWTGTVLLALFLVELATLLSVRQLITWHVVVGVLLVPPALLKTASTGWRIVGYYTGRAPYRQAGPPPMFLRVLGPLVVLSTLAVLGTGLALIFLGPVAGFAPLVSVVGYQVSTLTLHQATFIVWAVATGLHTLARLIPAWRILTTKVEVPGRLSRGVIVILALAAATIAAILLYAPAEPWFTDFFGHLGHHGH